MAGRQLIRACARQASKILRRRPWLSATALAVLVVVYIPIVPFFPACQHEPGGEFHYITARLSPHYRAIAKHGLRHWGAYVWDIGGQVFIRVGTALDVAELVYTGPEGALMTDILINVERKSAGYLDEDLIIQDDGSWLPVSMNSAAQIRSGTLYVVPDHLKQLMALDVRGDSCRYMYAAATGKPMPQDFGRD